MASVLKTVPSQQGRDKGHLQHLWHQCSAWRASLQPPRSAWKAAQQQGRSSLQARQVAKSWGCSPAALVQQARSSQQAWHDAELWGCSLATLQEAIRPLERRTCWQIRLLASIRCPLAGQTLPLYCWEATACILSGFCGAGPPSLH